MSFGIYDSDSESDWGDGLVFNPSPSLTRRFNTDELIVSDRYSSRFYARCSSHRGFCRHGRVVYTDGSCRNNGGYDSASGIGIAFGESEEDPETGEVFQFSIPVDDVIDPGGRRTSQRAELLAALHGLKKISEHDAGYFLEQLDTYGLDHPMSPEIIIASDSEYVVKGMTEWLPRWWMCTSANDPNDFGSNTCSFCFINKANGFRKTNGDQPSNLDLFLNLGAEIRACRHQYGCKVRFWKIDRGYNTIADELARDAT